MKITACKPGCENIVSKIYYRSVMREMDGRYYWVLYNSNMEPVREVFEFLNYTCIHQSVNSRAKSLQALKLLYSFSEIISKSFAEFSLIDIHNLKFFLKGTAPSGAEFSMELLTQRSNSTVNGYLAVFRSFLNSIGINNEPLLSTRHKVMQTEHIPDYNLRYRINEEIPVKSIEVPEYISVDEFALMLKIIREKYSLQEECIVRLMYQHGLRIGEVLGLTNDDLIEEKINGGWIQVLYIRNRVSDKPFQKAKTCMNVTDEKQYHTKDYQEYGFHKIILDSELYELLHRCICELHERIKDIHMHKYLQKSHADRIRKAEPFEEDNRYIFISRYGRPLRSDSWNRKLREIFLAAGICIDTQVRKHNLNHRLRHGFAMYQIKHMGRNELELMRLMRHSSLKSVEAYFKPTIKDQLEMKQEFAEELMKSVPCLRYSIEK